MGRNFFNLFQNQIEPSRTFIQCLTMRMAFMFWRRWWHPLQYSCLENPMDGGAWRAAVHGVARSRTRLSDFTFTFHFHALEKEMATHSSFLAWRIPGTGEPGGLPSMGSHRVGHDWSNLAAAAAAMDSVCFCRKNLFITKIFHYWGLLLTRNWCLICFPSNRKLASFKKKIKEWKQDRKKKIEKSKEDAIIFTKIHISGD